MVEVEGEGEGDVEVEGVKGEEEGDGDEVRLDELTLDRPLAVDCYADSSDAACIAPDCSGPSACPQTRLTREGHRYHIHDKR